MQDGRLLLSGFVKGYQKDRSVGLCEQWVGREQRSFVSHNNGMPTFEITIYIGYRSTSLTNFFLLMSLAAMEELDKGVGGGLRRGLLQCRLQSSVAEKDGISFQPMHKMASC
jgi:hypothetical protein